METKVIVRLTEEQFNDRFVYDAYLGNGNFGAVTVAMEVASSRKVTIKKAKIYGASIYRDREYLMLKRVAESPFVPAFLKAYKVGATVAAYVFRHEDLVDLKQAWR